MVDVLEDLWDIGGNDISLHLHNVYPTVELATHIRKYPNQIATITLANDAIALIDSTDDRTDRLSSISGNGLRQTLAPGVRLAGEFSLLISDYLTEDRFNEAVDESVILSVPPTAPMKDRYEAALTDDIHADESFSPSDLSSTDMQSDLQWYSD